MAARSRGADVPRSRAASRAPRRPNGRTRRDAVDALPRLDRADTGDEAIAERVHVAQLGHRVRRRRHAERVRHAERDDGDAVARKPETRAQIARGVLGIGDHAPRARDAARKERAQVPALLPRERLRARIDGEVMDGDHRRHGKAPGEQVLRPVVERDALGRDETGERPVIPRQLMVRRRHRHVHRAHRDVGEDVRPIREHDVLVAGLARERGDELAGVRARTADHTDLRADPDAH